MRALRRKIMVVVAVSTVAVAVLVLARSLPFASGSTSPAATGHSGVRNVGAGTAMGALNRLPVKGKAPMTGYARARFGRAWTDDADQGLTSPWGHNGCDTRNDALARDLDQAHTRPGSRCVIVSGKLHDPYTGATLTWRRGRHTSTTVQIDHVVALGNAWITGAQKLSPLQRTALANDPLNLLAVDGPPLMRPNETGTQRPGCLPTRPADATTWPAKSPSKRSTSYGSPPQRRPLWRGYCTAARPRHSL